MFCHPYYIEQIIIQRQFYEELWVGRKKCRKAKNKKESTRNLNLKKNNKKSVFKKWLEGRVSKYENIFLNFKGTERTSLNMFTLSRSSSKEEFCIKILKNIETFKWNFSFLNKCWFISWKFKLDLIVNCVDQPASLNVLNYKE